MESLCVREYIHFKWVHESIKGLIHERFLGAVLDRKYRNAQLQPAERLMSLDIRERLSETVRRRVTRESFENAVWCLRTKIRD